MVSENNHETDLAILALTRGGMELGLKLAGSIGNCTLFVPQRLAPESAGDMEIRSFLDWEQTFQRVFAQYQRIICIMAAGIVVRSLASCLQSKFVDPAIVVMDEKGRYAISLLSGHIGGANQLAREVAQLTGGQAVITTATDVQGKTAADLLALEMDALIDPPGNLKIINRCLAEDQPVYLYSPWPLRDSLKSGFIWRGWPPVMEEHESQDFARPAVIISPWLQPVEPAETLWLKPRNLSVGIGCRLGVAYQDLRLALNEVLTRFNIDSRCISNLASIEMKATEPGINLLAENMAIPFVTFSQEAIIPLAGTYDESAWVKEITGVGGVCEPAARLASQMGITLIPKQKIGPVAISVAMERSWWWDWDPATASI